MESADTCLRSNTPERLLVLDLDTLKLDIYMPKLVPGCYRTPCYIAVEITHAIHDRRRLSMLYAIASTD